MAPAAGSYLRPGEEDWHGVFDRLVERFPTFPPERVADILRQNNGHAGQAAAKLRDLSGTGMRPVDPDDAEHVRTLLSSPVMFSHACKEQFLKHDQNGDGVLEWSEILKLTNALYENFGLEAPREGGLRAFFEATDTNHDGVLSEREFKKFFECFLRYAFFDVMKHEQELAAAALAEAPQDSPASPINVASPAKAAPLGAPDHAGGRRKKPAAEEVARTSSAGSAPAPPAAGGITRYRCTAAHGVSFRRSPDYGDRAGTVIRKGETVQVLEQWIRTPNGWLPLVDKHGQVAFELALDHGHDKADPGDGDADEADQRAREKVRSHKSSGSIGAAPKRSSKIASEVDGGAGGAHRRSTSKAASDADAAAKQGPPDTGGQAAQEEDWQPRALRLQERFPDLSGEQVMQALRDHGGHAGQAAAALRALTLA
mmetsp:Transcript_25304/g.72960  ORF Transcript_25304/g.72960 Transcript_25304/m.72960 type:complete len:427 (-) Transcript_25304:30-1310(-)